MDEVKFTLFELLRENKIDGLIFDKFNQKNHFRLFPIDQLSLGAFEAYISASIIPRYQSKYFKGLELDTNDKKVLLYAFMHREQLGVPDGMSNIHEIPNPSNYLSPGSMEDNFIIKNNILMNLYNTIDNLTELAKPLTRALLDLLSHPMSFCYFDKVPIDECGSICPMCPKELRNEGYIIPESLIKNISRNYKQTNTTIHL